MKKVYIAATRQNDGKTIVSLGLLGAFRDRVNSFGYIKPVGQQYQEIGRQKIDKDALLMREVYSLTDELIDMNPIPVPSGFTRKYIQSGKRKDLIKKINQSFKHVSQKKDIVLIEGTGHAGVGSVFDMSNADVAKLLKAPVILVTCGGIGRPFDEIMLNKAVFDNIGVKLLGIILNKVNPEKYTKVKYYIKKGLAKKGIEVLGIIPFSPILSRPTIRQLLEDIEGKLLSGIKGLDNCVSKFVIGAMPPHEALNFFGGDTLLITPGNRDDLLMAAMSSAVAGMNHTYGVSGIILTSGIRPHKTIQKLIMRTDIPVILVKDDAFETATRINNLIVKVRPSDKDKIKASEDLVEKYVAVDKIFKLLA